MKSNRLVLLAFLFCCIFSRVDAQHNDLTRLSLYHAMYKADSVVDSTYGIQMYKKYNFHLGGTKTRNCAGHACNGWVEDYYLSKQLLHKGYYVNGQLMMFKNYYPNGNVERNFAAVNLYRSKMELYYSSGSIKSKITYSGSNPIQWEDFYPNGQEKYYEKYDKNYTYYLQKTSWYSNGQMSSDLEIESKKKKNYTNKTYFKDGKLKSEGQLAFSEVIYDYRREGTWKYFDESGKLIKTEKYVDGKINATKTY